MRVAAGCIVRTQYVSIDSVRVESGEPMSVGDVESALRRRVQLGKDQPWPCPVGQWEGDRFVIYDGRPDYVAALCLGVASILVAWMEDPE